MVISIELEKIAWDNKVYHYRRIEKSLKIYYNFK